MIKYSVFVSSVYLPLKDERNCVVDAILKAGFFPLAMETSTPGSFEEVKKLIDISDAVILILGDIYGSRDAAGISWTENEYLYARETGKHIFTLELPSLSQLRKKAEPNEDEKSQLKFAAAVGEYSYLCPVSSNSEIYEKISTHFNSIGMDNIGLGWERRIDENKWRGENPWFDLKGTWYSLHVSNDDVSYLRVGTVQIGQNFNPREYCELSVRAINYNCVFDAGANSINENISKSTKWQADYELYLDFGERIDKIVGVFVATRNFEDRFADDIIIKGNKKGVHSFDIFEYGDDNRINSMVGSFSNVGSAKEGEIALFRTREMRDEYLFKNYPDVLENNKR